MSSLATIISRQLLRSPYSPCTGSHAHQSMLPQAYQVATLFLSPVCWADPTSVSVLCFMLTIHGTAYVRYRMCVVCNPSAFGCSFNASC